MNDWIKEKVNKLFFANELFSPFSCLSHVSIYTAAALLSTIKWHSFKSFLFTHIIRNRSKQRQKRKFNYQILFKPRYVPIFMILLDWSSWKILKQLFIPTYIVSIAKSIKIEIRRCNGIINESRIQQHWLKDKMYTTSGWHVVCNYDHMQDKIVS